MGILPLSGIAWFVFFASVMLYLNLVVISKRRWAAGQQLGMGFQYAHPAVCLLITCGSLLVIF